MAATTQLCTDVSAEINAYNVSVWAAIDCERNLPIALGWEGILVSQSLQTDVGDMGFTSDNAPV